MCIKQSLLICLNAEAEICLNCVNLSKLCKPGGKLRETPLHIAARVKDGDRCALMLLKSGAGPNIKTDDGQTPVHVAAKHGNLVTLMLLMDDGGDPLFKSKVIFYIVSCLCSIGILCPVHT